MQAFRKKEKEKNKQVKSEKKQAELKILKDQLDELMEQAKAETNQDRIKELIHKMDQKRNRIEAVQSGKLLTREAKKNLIAYSFIAPNFIGFAVFTLIPVVFAFVLAFTQWDGSNPMKFIGLGNFKEIFQNTMFLAALRNTILYSVGTVPLTMIASLALAIVLNQKVFCRGIFRTISFFPYVASLVAVTAVWKMLFSKSGPINAILFYVFHLSKNELPQWFVGSLVMVSFILFSVWKYMGYYMVIYLAGLQGISAELYEAASLDGANTWKKFLYITWPQLQPTTFFVSVMLMINCFKVFDVAVLLAGGDNNVLTESSEVLVHFIYQKAFGEWNLGYASAVAMVLFGLVLAVTLIQFRGESKFANS